MEDRSGAVDSWVAREKGAHFLEIERYDLAERTLAEALVRDPHNPDLLTLLGHVYRDWNRPEDAERCAREAVESNPGDPLALALLAVLSSDSGRNTESERLYLEALRFDPTNPFLLKGYAHLMYRAGQLEKAQRLAEASLEQDPEDAGAHSMLAVILTERSRKSAAEGAGREGLRLSPDEEYSHLGAGLAFYGNGRPFKAKRHIREALRLNPDDPDTISLFEEIDFYTRWTSVVFYYWSWLINKVPGRQFLVWAVVLATAFALNEIVDAAGRHVHPDGVPGPRPLHVARDSGHEALGASEATEMTQNLDPVVAALRASLAADPGNVTVWLHLADLFDRVCEDRGSDRRIAERGVGRCAGAGHFPAADFPASPGGSAVRGPDTGRAARRDVRPSGTPGRTVPHSPGPGG